MGRIQPNTKETTCSNIPTPGKTNESNGTKLDTTHGEMGNGRREERIQI